MRSSISATLTPTRESQTPKPVLSGRRGNPEQYTVAVFVILPLLTLVAAVPFAWGWGLSWWDIGLAAGFYVVSSLGVTVGYHRYFTHGSFKAKRPLRIALALAGSLASQGSVVTWVADHRRHHAFSDREGDPHSPWLFGTSPLAIARGFWHSHMGWLFQRDKTNAERFAPDLLTDKDIQLVDKLFVPMTVVTLGLPGLIGGLATMSWWGAVTAIFWAGFVRVAFLHHITWSVNSVCHMIGDRPYVSRDRAANFWPLAILSMGESWHNSHHADPTGARHGVRRGQVDISARVIWIFEKLGWAWAVRWPRPERLAAKLAT